METIVGQTVSHYEFLEKLGAGGMGEIYKARDLRLNRFVAIKVLTSGKTRDSERRRRFIQEAQAASGLNHPNIVTIHDILSEGDTHYMVMEYVSGKTLLQLIAAGRLPASHAIEIATQLANALATAHAAGIIHRDLKPANVMVTDSGLAKILDFGLAKLMDPSAPMRSPVSDSSQTAETLSAPALTVEGSIMGTVNYMSPEQAEGLRVDARSDIFSFGAVLYEMVTGQRAFHGDSPISTLSAVLRDDARPIPEIVPGVPAELNDLIARCLQKNPDDRWQSMTEVAASLRALRARLDSGRSVLSEVPPPSPSPAPSELPARRTAPKRSVLIAEIGLGVVALVIAGFWWRAHQSGAVAMPKSTAPLATATPSAPQPAPPPAPASEPDIKPENNNQTPQTISPTAALPPSTPVVPLTTKAKPLAPPPVVVTPRQPVPVASAPAAPPTVAPPSHASAPAEVLPVTLGDGVPFRIALDQDIPTSAEVGQSVRFRALDGLQSGDAVVIPKGAIVTGSVAALGKRNFFGERGKVRFRLISAVSVDGSEIRVRATPEPKTDGEETRAFESPKGPKTKGISAISGTEYTAYIAGDQTVNLRK